MPDNAVAQAIIGQTVSQVEVGNGRGLFVPGIHLEMLVLRPKLCEFGYE